MQKLRIKTVETGPNQPDLDEEAAQDPGPQERLQPGQCAFCLRVLKNGTTEHHLIPRRCHKNRWFQKRFSREQMQETVSTCRACHHAIHRFVPREKDLGRSFNTIASLLAHPDFARFVDWASRQR